MEHAVQPRRVDHRKGRFVRDVEFVPEARLFEGGQDVATGLPQNLAGVQTLRLQAEVGAFEPGKLKEFIEQRACAAAVFVDHLKVAPGRLAQFLRPLQAQLRIARDAGQRVFEVVRNVQDHPLALRLRLLPKRGLALDPLGHVVERLLQLGELVFELQVHPRRIVARPEALRALRELLKRRDDAPGGDPGKHRRKRGQEEQVEDAHCDERSGDALNVPGRRLPVERHRHVEPDGGGERDDQPEAAFFIVSHIIMKGRADCMAIDQEIGKACGGEGLPLEGVDALRTHHLVAPIHHRDAAAVFHYLRRVDCRVVVPHQGVRRELVFHQAL